MTRERLTFLFHRYVNQTISESERSEFFNAVAQSGHDTELKELMDALWASVPDKTSSEVPSHVFDTIIQKNNVSARSTRSPWLAIAASLSALLIIGAAAFFTLRSTDNVIESLPATASTTHQKSFIRLPDGSTVVLNAGSFLNYPQSFEGEKHRIVNLKGEGFFDIKHDPAHPFKVISGNVVTTVLGTAFNIKASPNEKEVTVTVSRGKVEVSADKKLVGVLTKDQRVTIKNGLAYKPETVLPREATAWMEKEIVFDDVTLTDALAELEDRFNVTIKLMNERASECRFTGSFVHEENIEQILLVISEFNNVTMQRNAETGEYEITGAGCNGSNPNQK